MAKGSEAKETIITKILETFPGSFRYDKEVRIPMIESGEAIQIKVALTCAKVNVDGGNESVSSVQGATPTPAASNFMNQPTAEEKAAVEALCEKLNITN